MQAVIGGNVRYPNLQSIANLFRASINDTANNTSGTGTGTGNEAGLIMPNSNPDLTTFMDSAIYEVFSDLRNVGDPELILDNYILTGLPALTQQDPAVQVALGYAGFYNGYTWNSTWKLPINTCRVIALWERESGVGADFVPMKQVPAGLPGVLQGTRMGMWEMRQGAIWMPGCTLATDIRIRARIGWPAPVYSSNLDFTTTYVPILDCGNAVAAKMRILYAARFAPEQYPLAIAEEKRLMDKLRLEVVRGMQWTENERMPYGDDAVQDFAISWSWL